jgi:mutator protein MutT
MSSTSEPRTPVRVAIGLIERDGCYLIRQRPPGSIMAGIWEFPGGKCEPDESEEEAVRRECLEETCLRVEVVRTRSRIEHDYPHGFIRLTYFDCRPVDATSEPGTETGFRWVRGVDLAAYAFPPANESIINELARA